MTRPAGLFRTPPAEPTLGGWTVSAQVAATLAQVVHAPVPILCLRCYGPAFTRLARAIHIESGAERLVPIDLRAARGAADAALLRAVGGSLRDRPDSPFWTTVAIDGIERLDRDSQASLLLAFSGQPIRLISGSALELE